MNRLEDGVIYWTCPNCGAENTIEQEEILSECCSCDNLCDVSIDDNDEVIVEEF